MQMSVWLVTMDDGDTIWWHWVCAESRAAARKYADVGDPGLGDPPYTYRVRQVDADGNHGPTRNRRKPQATVEAVYPRYLTEAELFALGWIQDEDGSYRVGSLDAARAGYEALTGYLSGAALPQSEEG